MRPITHKSAILPTEAELISTIAASSQWYPGIVSIVDLRTNRYAFVSDSVQSMLGVSPEQFQQEEFPQLLEYFVKEHEELFVKEIYPRLFEAMAVDANPKKNDELLFSYVLKVKNHREENRWFKHQIKPVAFDKNGQPVLAVKYVMDVTDCKKSEEATVQLDTEKNGQLRRKYKLRFASPSVGELVSKRESEILSLIGDGLSNKEISEVLFISEHTVHTHRKNMLRKNGLANISQMLKLAYVHGLLG